MFLSNSYLTAVMVPKVTVPCDFGREYIGSELMFSENGNKSVTMVHQIGTPVVTLGTPKN